DEIWHAGDIGDISIIDKLSKITTVRAVFGNIDNHIIRAEYREDVVVTYGENKILMTHIGGKPFAYNKISRLKIKQHNPNVFICGHSHICKIMHDNQYQLLFINPGAAGNKGFHRVRTLVRFELTKYKIQNLEVVELGTR
ncbi:MAG: metallophosphoesterase family protein, partial [Bacteroidota bacterium]|nr:metallophosphoesterase family protein [Bacteroidota bacterium]